MIIQKIVIKENEKITMQLSFKKRLTTVIKSDIIIDVINNVMGNATCDVYVNDYTFCAEVDLSDTFFICGQKNHGSAFWDISVTRKGSAIDCAQEYFNEIKVSGEMEELSCFCNFKAKKYPHRINSYKDVSEHYTEGEFARITNGYGTTRCFRSFTNNYIKTFEPIRLRKEKDLFLKLLPNGKFIVENSESDECVTLSQSEKLLYHYYSFIAIVDFWERAEKIRNMNLVKKPILISGLFEFLDESINLEEICNRTKKIGRQVILLIGN